VTTGNDFSASFGDYDRDGDLDLFLAHWGAIYPGAVQHLWQNQGDGDWFVSSIWDPNGVAEETEHHR
jgi:hypothetical protein